MLKRIPFRFTTLQSGQVRPELEDVLTDELLRDPSSYTSNRPLANSGSAGIFALETQIAVARAEANGIVPVLTQPLSVALGVPELTQYRRDFLDESDEIRAVWEFNEWSRVELHLRTPELITGPMGWEIQAVPVVRPLPKGVGQGTHLLFSDGDRPHRALDQPNWLHTGEFDVDGLPIPWEAPGALGVADIDMSLASVRVPLTSPTGEGIDSLTIPLPTGVMEGFADGSLTGLRLVLLPTPSLIERVFGRLLDSTGGVFLATEDFEIIQTVDLLDILLYGGRQILGVGGLEGGYEVLALWRGEPLRWSNALSRHQLTIPLLEVGTQSQFLDHSSAFDPDVENVITFWERVNGIKRLPESVRMALEDVSSGNTSLDTVVGDVELVGRLRLLRAQFEVSIPFMNGSTAEWEAKLGTKEMRASVQIDPVALETPLSELLGLESGPNPAAWGVSDPDEIPDYDDDSFRAGWVDPLNEAWRRDRPVVLSLDGATLRDAMEGSPNYLFQLEAHWTIPTIGSSSTRTVKSSLIPMMPDPVGSNASMLDGSVFPRVAVATMKEVWSRSEGPQRVEVFVENRGPQPLTNQEIRRSNFERRSALFTDLAWGIVSGNSEVGSVGRWEIEPSVDTLLSHDGFRHWFWFDPEGLPRGLWRYEFVRLNTGARMRSINPRSFRVID